MADIFEKTALGSPWKELFTNVARLNEYFRQGNNAEIRDVKIENYDLSGARFENAKFENTEWRQVIARNAIFKNTVFHKCKMDGLEFEQSIFENVTFENCELTDVSFFESKLPGVRFINSKLKDETTFQKISNGELLFDHVTMNKVAFFQAQAKIVVKGSKLDRVKMNAMLAPSSLTFEKSELNNIEFSRSVLERLIMTGVTAKKGGFEGGKIGRLEISDSSFGLSFREMEIDHVIYQRNVIRSRYNRSRIGEIRVTACKEVNDFGFFEAKVGTLHIDNCDLSMFDLADATISSLSISNGAIVLSDFSGMKVKNAKLDNVVLDKELDFSNAYIEQMTTNSVTRSPGLKLITTGSNVKFD